MSIAFEPGGVVLNGVTLGGLFSAANAFLPDLYDAAQYFSPELVDTPYRLGEVVPVKPQYSRVVLGAPHTFMVTPDKAATKSGRDGDAIEVRVIRDTIVEVSR